MADSGFRCGFVAVVGRPNVGKSTLVNALVGTKVSIVSAKPQTTRHRILGVANGPGGQIIFVDTPGMHQAAGKAMNRIMNQTAAAALADADLALFVTECGRWTAEDAAVLDRLRGLGSPVIAILNKVDRVHPKEAVLEHLAEMSRRFDFAELVPTSATRSSNLDALRGMIPAYLPESPALFPQDMETDRGPAFRAAETIREKLMEILHQELPYGLTVDVQRYEQRDNKLLVEAIIWVERESQKGIVIGSSGNKLKQAGREARVELRDRLGMPVHLDLWVKVKRNWADSEADLRALGFDEP
jgi:GTP-binding protein Era